MKKSIYLILITSIILLGCSKNDDDLNSDLYNKSLNTELIAKGAPETVDFSVSHYFTGGYWTPLICDGVEVGYLEGTLNVHCVMFGHYNPDYPGDLNHFVWQWMVMNYSGSLTNQATGEIFTIKESDKWYYGTYSYTWHSNIRGNQGSHYIIFGSGLFVYPYTFTIDKVICPSSD